MVARHVESDVKVIVADIDSLIGVSLDYEGSLSEPERRWLVRFQNDEVRQRAVARRWFLRQAVGVALGQDPENVQLSWHCPRCGHDGGHGAPLVASGQYLSASSTAELATVAVASEPLGVDIEDETRAQGLWEAAAAWLSADEKQCLQSSGDRSPRALARLWTGKESFLKLLRVGLAVDPASLSLIPVDVPPVGRRAYSAATTALGVVGMDGHSPRALVRWVDVAPAAVVAVATHTARRIALCGWDAERGRDLGPVAAKGWCDRGR